MELLQNAQKILTEMSPFTLSMQVILHVHKVQVDCIWTLNFQPPVQVCLPAIDTQLTKNYSFRIPKSTYNIRIIYLRTETYCIIGRTVSKESSKLSSSSKKANSLKQC